MARRCDVCGKGPRKSASRSHSKIKTLRKQYPNLQVKTVDGKRLKICTACIKTIGKAPSTKKAAAKKK